MNIYSTHGLNDFVICCGHKGNQIKQYFKNYTFELSDFTLDMRGDGVTVHRNGVEPWRFTRQVLGTAIFFGMLGVTIFGLIFTPIFYVVVRGMTDWRSRRRSAPPAA